MRKLPRAVMPKEELETEYVRLAKLHHDLLKSRCGANLFLFNKYILGVEEGEGKVPLADFHREICYMVQNRRDRKKLLLVPRGHLKSTLITIGYPIFCLVENVNTRVLILNATWQMAVDFLTEIKNHLQKNERLISTFGSLAENPIEWSQDRITLQRSDHGVKGPTVWATGIESNLVGSHPDLIIMDDVVNRDIADSEDLSSKVILRYKDALDLLEPGGQMIVIGTRWNDKDLYDWIINPENKVVQNYDVLVKPAFEFDGPLSGVFSEGGEALMRSRLWPGKFSYNELKSRYREKGPYEFCTPAETPILMADWTVKPICEVKPGEMVMGWEGGASQSKLVLMPVKVLKRSSTTSKVNDLIMESGRKVRCTRGHRWYTGRQDKSHRLYKPAKVGSRLMYVCPTDLSCLSNERSASDRVVYEKVREVLTFLRLDFNTYHRRHNKNKWRDSKILWLKDNFETLLKFIRFTELAKKFQLIERLYRHGKNFVRKEDRVVEIIEGSEEEEVFALETETGNYVAWGYASSNSAQYLNDPIPDEAAVFRKEWFKYVEIEDWRGRMVNRYMAIDPAISLSKEADYTGIVICDIDQFGTILVRHVDKLRLTPSDLIRHVFFLADQYKPNSIGIEAVAFQKTLQYFLNEEMRRRGKYLPLREISPQDRTKGERIKALQPLYANGKILHSKAVRNLSLLEDELTRFPRGKHDDVIDAFSYLLDMIVPPRPRAERYHHRYLYGQN